MCSHLQISPTFSSGQTNVLLNTPAHWDSYLLLLSLVPSADRVPLCPWLPAQQLCLSWTPTSEESSASFFLSSCLVNPPDSWFSSITLSPVATKSVLPEAQICLLSLSYQILIIYSVQNQVRCKDKEHDHSYSKYDPLFKKMFIRV